MTKRLLVAVAVIVFILAVCACNYEAQPYVSSSSVSQEVTELSPPTESEAKKLARKEIENYWASKNVDPLSWGFLIEGEKLYYHADDDTWSYNGLIMYNGGKTKSPFTAAIAVDIDKAKNEYDVDLFYFIFDNQVEIEKKDMLDSNGLYHRGGVSASAQK